MYTRRKKTFAQKAVSVMTTLMSWAIIAIVGIALLFLVKVGIQAWNATETQVTATVTKAERVNYGDTSKYLIFTQSETFENVDSYIFMKFNSSDVYATIFPGETYCFHVVGWRVEYWSMYRNIIDLTPGECPTEGILPPAPPE